MTVCIAAIAAKSKAIVCIADRALTFAGASSSAQTDSGVTKIVDIPNTRWCAMFSSEDLAFPERVLGIVTREIGKKKRDEINRAVMELAVKAAFYEQWQLEIEDRILKPKLLTRESLTAIPLETRDARVLNTEYLNILAQEMADHRNNCCMIFCGFDGEDPQIFSCSTPAGQINPCNWQGFQVMGEGEETARNHLIWSEFDKHDSLDSVLYDVFNAKCATEVLQGIGYAWDWKIIIPGSRPKPLPVRIDSLIDRVWMTLNRSPFSEKLSKKERAPSDWKKRLGKFSTHLLSGSKRLR
jgi:hypothetical protein